MLKNVYFLENTVKIVSASGAPSPNLRLPPATGAPPQAARVVTLSYYYNFIEFVSSIQCVSLSSKKDKMTPVHVFCFYIFRTFAPIFHFKICRF